MHITPVLLLLSCALPALAQSTWTTRASTNRLVSDGLGSDWTYTPPPDCCPAKEVTGSTDPVKDGRYVLAYTDRTNLAMLPYECLNSCLYTKEGANSRALYCFASSKTSMAECDATFTPSTATPVSMGRSGGALINSELFLQAPPQVLRQYRQLLSKPLHHRPLPLKPLHQKLPLKPLHQKLPMKPLHKRLPPEILQWGCTMVDLNNLT